MSEIRRVHAPYNFIPFSETVLLREGSLPHHDVWDPALKTGEIRIRLRAETPVFVSDGNGKDLHFFRLPNGQLALPGSTIRGMARENMQILGYGLLRPGEDLEDYQILFRKVADARGSTGGALKAYYHSALDVKSFRGKNNRTSSVPQNVHAGYLCCEGGRYRIYPTAGPLLRVSRAHPDVQQFGDGHARTIRVLYRADQDTVKEIRRDDARTAGGMKRGELLFTGRPVNRGANHLYLFPAADHTAAPMEVSGEDALSYREDWENRKNTLGEGADFWKLPEPGEQKPVFYVQHNGHIYFGMSRFLRIGYQYPLSHGLPDHHRQYWQEHVLDLPHAILGYADAGGSYRSRVSFGDLLLAGAANEMPPVSMVLSGPKLSYYPGYVVADEAGHSRNYNDERFRLRGYKQYWNKPVEKTSAPEGNEKVGTTMRPLPAGTVFEGVVRYQNLTEEELGLLLWSIRLDEGCFQNIGMGKPYGYGRVKPEILQLSEYDPGAMYGGDLQLPPASGDLAAVERYITAYNRYAAKRVGGKAARNKELRERPEIRDFFYMKSTIRQAGEEVAYMSLKEYQNTQEALPNVRSIREAAEKKAGEKPAEKPQSMEDMLAALQAKHKGL